MKSEDEDVTWYDHSLLVGIQDDAMNAGELTPERKISSGSDPSSDKSLVSAASGSTIFGIAEFNKPVLLIIDPTKVGREIALFFTMLRAKTNLGETQGDHVIAHRLFLEFCARIVAGCSLIEAPKKLQEALKTVIPDIMRLNDLQDYPRLPENFPEYNEAVLGLLKTAMEQSVSADRKEEMRLAVEDYKLGVRQKRASIVVENLSELFAYYNSMSDVAYEKTGNKGSSEPSDIGSAILALRAIDACLSMGQSPSQEAKAAFFKEAVELNGSYVRGMKKIFGVGIDEVRKSFRGLNKVEDFYRSFSAKVFDPSLAGSLIENFFDYPYPAHDEVEGLSKLIDRCLMMVLKTFPGLSLLDQTVMKESFVRSVLEHQGWKSIPDLTARQVLDTIDRIQKGYRLLPSHDMSMKI